MNHLSRSLAALSAAFTFFVAAGCVDSIGAADPVTVEETTFASSLGVNLSASKKTANGVFYRDITVGGGPPVTIGQQLSVRYTGWLSNGQQFGANDPGDVFVFNLGSGDVIDGWDEGIPGMRVGGTRQLIIPPSMGYGPFGAGPIPGNAVIVFEVQIVTAR